jgi:tetratricopeptide (TPR) repeat protein
MLKGIAILFLLLNTLMGLGQSNPSDEFNEAKRLMSNQQLRSAMSAFEVLKTDPQLGVYAYFFEGLCYSKNADYKRAIDNWEVIEKKFPNWPEQDEVFYWLTLAYFELNEYAAAFNFLDRYNAYARDSEFSSRVINKYCLDLSVIDLLEHNRAHPNYRQLSLILARKLIIEKDLSEYVPIVNQLKSKYNFTNENLINGSLKDEYASSYAIAVTLPFMFDSLGNPNTVIRNKVIIEFYQGMLHGQSVLRSKGIQLNFYDFDTQKSKSTTDTLLPYLNEADLIVGPLYAGPISSVKSLSIKDSINIINPFTNNEEFIEDNPFAFMFKPKSKTVALKLAEFVAESDTNKNVAIFYQNDRDSISGQVYRDFLEEKGFNILGFKHLDENSSKLLLDDWIETKKVYYTKNDADSISEISGRKIIYADKVADYLIDQETGKWLVAYEDKFIFPKDSINHMFIATESSTVINNLLGALVNRDEKVSVYGYGNWFFERTVNYELLQKLNVKLAVDDFIDKESLVYEQFRDDFLSEFHQSPSTYHQLGYEFIMFIGGKLNEHGKYFQNSLNMDLMEGYLMEGNWYPGTRDNQVVPIIEMQDFRLKRLN